jgi:hypothetical protein
MLMKLTPAEDGAKMTEVSDEEFDKTLPSFLALPLSADFFKADFGGFVSATATLSPIADSMLALTAASYN